MMTMADDLLWYDAPARLWTDALPLGNGRLGAMVFGNPVSERLQINESTFWAGGPYRPVNPDAYSHLGKVRELIFAGHYAQAEALAEEHLMAQPIKQMSYQPIGDLHIDFPHSRTVTNYRRTLDLDTAIATTSYVADGTTFFREAFISAVDGVLVLRLSADRPRSIKCRISLDSPQQGQLVEGQASQLTFSGTGKAEWGIAGALRFALGIRVINKGGMLSFSNGISVDDADELVILLDAATSFRRSDDVSGDPDGTISARLSRASARSHEIMRRDHMAEHQKLFRSFAIDLGTTPAAIETTDRRIAGFAGGHDPALASLYVQFGRYLMIASSRPGTQPANLQGIWNDETDPPWGSKYTANINLQMNYWLPAPANLRNASNRLSQWRKSLPKLAARRRRCIIAPVAGSCTTTLISGARLDRSTVPNGACGRPAAPGSWRNYSILRTILMMPMACAGGSFRLPRGLQSLSSMCLCRFRARTIW